MEPHGKFAQASSLPKLLPPEKLLPTEKEGLLKELLPLPETIVWRLKSLNELDDENGLKLLDECETPDPDKMRESVALRRTG